MSQSKLYVLKEAAKCLGITSSALSKRIHKGTLVATKDAAGHWAISQDTLDQLRSEIKAKHAFDLEGRTMGVSSVASERSMNLNDATLNRQTLRKEIDMLDAKLESKKAAMAQLNESIDLLEALIRTKQQLLKVL
ncbi:hypothetical protein [Bifidobacterium aerophilum]|uniref:Helix-turn-helix domain-containing protein n=1 Tax=Bifidobacterium aerophilum TaxID=1798155 RepID=A0A6N9Z5N6_9BIFI|nr:hypothetical protein [Bifidobacterium aerophilum]NEG89952.1 hypothetical protein [Bifidobacterium aerophilum]